LLADVIFWAVFGALSGLAVSSIVRKVKKAPPFLFAVIGAIGALLANLVIVLAWSSGVLSVSGVGLLTSIFGALAALIIRGVLCFRGNIFKIFRAFVK
jgi:uncharacterized membrane protein YeaQ/YmgE (transglycosylase-associated protein family)